MMQYRIRSIAGAMIGAILPLLLVLAAYGADRMPSSSEDDEIKGYDITASGLRPRYPSGYSCSPLTSLYASWKDVDGTGREEPHSGVDGGRLGEEVLAPAPGKVVAVWVADWGWGSEGALLIRHSAEDLNLSEGVGQYYSAFYHLNHDELRSYKAGQRIERGQVLAHVFRPGGKSFYLPEVHLETYEVRDDAATKWHENDRGRAYWTNRTSRLIDPLYLLAREEGTLEGTHVLIEPFQRGKDYSEYSGFTYFLPCSKRK